MIVVATADFEVYHDLVGELRDRGVEFTTIEPAEELPEGTNVVVTGPDDDEVEGPKVVEAEPDAPRRAVETALASLRGGTGRTVVGVDPGRKPGIAVLHGDVVVAAFQVPVTDAARVVREEVADAPDPVVRVGDGARRDGAQIVDDLEGLRVELVDETGTTPYLGTGARGMGDVLAATNIARLGGEAVESREFEPTEGEIKRVQARSRELSAQNRTIDEDLARRVARGDLEVEAALAEHRDDDANGDDDAKDADEPDAVGGEDEHEPDGEHEPGEEHELDEET